jgi:hypothetical protein
MWYKINAVKYKQKICICSYFCLIINRYWEINKMQVFKRNEYTYLYGRY